MADLIIPFCVGWLIAMTATAFFLKFWVWFTWKVLGWKPKLIRDDLLDNTAKYCTSHLVRHFVMLSEDATNALTDEQRGDMHRDMEEYTRWAIECYIEKYLTVGKVVRETARVSRPEVDGFAAG